MSTQFAPTAATYNSSTPPYVISASSFLGGFPPYFAFDGGAGNYWLGTGGGVDWLQLRVGSGDLLALDSYSITVNTIPEPTRAPKDWMMQGSNDGSSWSTIDTQTNQLVWTSGETRTFSPGSVTGYAYLRLNITANNGDGTYTQVESLKLYTNTTLPTDFAPHTMSNNSTPSPYVTSANTDNTDAYRAFDGSKAGGNSWIGTAGGAGILEIDVSSATLLLGYSLFGSANAANRSPKDWTVQGSNDNSSWTTVDTESSQTSWGTSSVVECRSFPCATATTAYRYFRINITANNGDGTNTDIAEMYLWQGVTPPPAGTLLGGSSIDGIGGTFHNSSLVGGIRG